MPTPFVDNYQNENGYPVDAEVLTALVQEAGLNRTGLIYEKVFKPINTNGLCEVMGIDYKATFDTAGVETFKDKNALLTGSDNSMTCTSEIKEIEAPKFSRRHYPVKYYANKIPMTECCLNMCGMGQDEYKRLVDDLKLNQLVDTYLINREKAGIDLLTGGGVGAWNAGWADGDAADLLDCGTDTDIEGVAFDFKAAFANGACDKTADVQTFFQNIQTADMKCSGRRNKVIMDKKALWAFRRNEALRGSGCQVPASVAMEIIMAEFDVDEIIIADSYSNVAAAGVSADLQKVWGKGFMLFFQRDDIVSSLEDARTKQNFAVDLKKYDQYLRVIRQEEFGENGIEWLSHHYSYTPEIHNLKAGTLIHNIF